MEYPEILSVEDLTQITGKAESTVRQMLNAVERQGGLPGRRIGKRAFAIQRSLFLQSLINGLISRYFSVAEAAEIKAKLEPKSK